MNKFVLIKILAGLIACLIFIYDNDFLEVFNLFLFIISFYLTIDYLSYQKSIKASCIIAIVCGFVFLDISYSMYFNLFYSFFINCVLFILLLQQKRYNKYLLMSLIFINSIVLILYPYSKKFSNINKYHSMTRGVLMTSENPEKALAEFGINKQFAILNNSNYYQRYPVVNVESAILKDNFYSHYNSLSISLYYTRHPNQVIDMLNMSMENSYASRSPHKIFIIYNKFKEKIIPSTVGFMIIWCILAIIIGYKNKYRTVVIAVIIFMGIFQILLSIINSGDTNLFKDTFLYKLVFNFVNLIGVSFVIKKIF